MPEAPLPENEEGRLAALRATGVLDRDLGPALDPLLRVARYITGARHGVVNLIDSDRQTQAAALEADRTEVPRSASMCSHVVSGGRAIWTRDASLDARFSDNPFVTGDIGDVRFYASVPLQTYGGMTIGTMCVYDTEERDLTDSQLHRLHDLAELMMSKIDPPRMGGPANSVLTSGPGGQAQRPVAVDQRPASSDVEELERAIAEDELFLMYQPKIDLDSGRCRGVEALVRWQHPTKGTVFPDDFIPLAESSGLIEPLTLWTIRAALDQIDRWRAERRFLTVGVNLSAAVLGGGGLFDELEGIIRSSDVPAASLALELTETAVMSDPATAIARLDTLARMGIEIAIDDFGTGYSSLVQLRDIPARVLKIDKGFVMDLRQNESNGAIVRSTIELGQSLGMILVAEGVEDQETLDELRLMGCDQGQGYHWSKPVPPEDLCSLLDRMTEQRPETPVVRQPLRISRPAWTAYADALRHVLHATDHSQIRRAVHGFVQRVGGSLRPADSLDPDLIPLDLSLGGPSTVAMAPRRTVARSVLERILPELAEDARRAQDRLSSEGA